MSGSYKKTKTELVAIYKLQFYQKQKHWKFVGETRRQKEAAIKKKAKESSKAVLNTTYSVERAVTAEPPEADHPSSSNEEHISPPSLLNEAFLDDGRDSTAPPNTPVAGDGEGGSPPAWPSPRSLRSEGEGEGAAGRGGGGDECDGAGWGGRVPRGHTDAPPARSHESALQRFMDVATAAMDEAGWEERGENRGEWGGSGDDGTEWGKGVVEDIVETFRKMGEIVANRKEWERKDGKWEEMREIIGEWAKIVESRGELIESGEDCGEWEEGRGDGGEWGGGKGDGGEWERGAGGEKETEEERFTRQAHCNPHSTELDLSECVSSGVPLSGRARSVRCAALAAREELGRRPLLEQGQRQRAIQEWCSEEPTRDVGLGFDPFVAGSHKQHPDRSLSDSPLLGDPLSNQSRPLIPLEAPQISREPNFAPETDFAFEEKIKPDEFGTQKTSEGLPEASTNSKSQYEVLKPSVPQQLYGYASSLEGSQKQSKFLSDLNFGIEVQMPDQYGLNSGQEGRQRSFRYNVEELKSLATPKGQHYALRTPQAPQKRNYSFEMDFAIEEHVIPDQYRSNFNLEGPQMSSNQEYFTPEQRELQTSHFPAPRDHYGSTFVLEEPQKAKNRKAYATVMDFELHDSQKSFSGAHSRYLSATSMEVPQKPLRDFQESFKSVQQPINPSELNTYLDHYGSIIGSKGPQKATLDSQGPISRQSLETMSEQARQQIAFEMCIQQQNAELSEQLFPRLCSSSIARQGFTMASENTWMGSVTVAKYDPSKMPPKLPFIDHMPQHDPTMMQFDPTITQHQDPTMSRHGPMTAQHGPPEIQIKLTTPQQYLSEHNPAMTPRNPTNAQNMAYDSPRVAQQFPNMAHDSPVPQHFTAMLQNIPTMAQQGPTRSQQGPTMQQQGPTMLQQNSSLKQETLGPLGLALLGRPFVSGPRFPMDPQQTARGPQAGPHGRGRGRLGHKEDSYDNRY